MLYWNQLLQNNSVLKVLTTDFVIWYVYMGDCFPLNQKLIFHFHFHFVVPSQVTWEELHLGKFFLFLRTWELFVKFKQLIIQVLCLENIVALPEMGYFFTKVLLLYEMQSDF